MTGLLSNLDEALAKRKNKPAPPPETIEERQAGDARLDAVLADAAQRDVDREMDGLVGPVLEKKYELALGEIYDSEVAQLQRKSPAVRKESAALFAKCRAMCREAGVSDYPVSGIMIAAWLHEEAQGGASYVKIKKCSAAAAYFHRINGFTDPTEHVLARAVLRANVGRKSTKPKKRKALNGHAEKATGQAH